jgi:predicted membrane-bound spermidine synthase
MRDRPERFSIKSISPFILIFFTSAGVMALELVASRLVGRYLGSSIYTWSAIIAVILTGLSIGNFLGGKAADRYAAGLLIPWLSLLTAVASVSTLVLCNYFGEMELLRSFAWPLRIIITVASIFIIPTILMGMMSPILVKLNVESTPGMGRAVGSVYAWGAIGSIAGTLMTGFFLIPTLKVSNSLLIISFFFSRA